MSTELGDRSMARRYVSLGSGEIVDTQPVPAVIIGCTRPMAICELVVKLLNENANREQTLMSDDDARVPF